METVQLVGFWRMFLSAKGDKSCNACPAVVLKRREARFAIPFVNCARLSKSELP